MIILLVLHVLAWVVATASFVLATADGPGLLTPIWHAEFGAFVIGLGWSISLLL